MNETTWAGARRLSLLLATALGATPAVAQSISDPSPLTAQTPSADDEGGLNIIVTAQRRAERLLDVPLAITAITAEDLARRGATRLQDLQFSVPGLWSVETSPGSERLQIRGISQQTGLPTVATYLDELNLNPNAVTGGTVLRAVDLERIEVLKGPQPTLYGEGSMGGTIRYITANPDLDTVRVRGEASVGSVDRGDTAYRAEGAVSIPIAAGTFAVRLSGGYEYTGGFVDTGRGKNVNGVRYSTIRGKALYRPTDAFEASLMYMHQEWDQRDADYAFDDLTYVYANSIPQPQKGNYDVANLILTYDAGPVQLLSSSGYYDVSARSDVFFPFAVPLPGGALLPLASTSRSAGRLTRFAQELRLTSDTDGPLTYLLGATYTNDKTSNANALAPPFADSLPLAAGQTSEAWAVYGEGAYRLGPATLTLGARYFSDRRSDSARRLFNTFTTFNPRINLSLRTGSTGIVYVNASKGFRSGGFNVPGKFDPAGDEATYAPEKLWTYELGFKQQFLDRRLSVEGSLYYHDYADIQSILLPIDLTPTIGRTINSGIARGWGQELAIVARPDNHLTTTFTVGHNDLTYRTLSLAVAPGDPLDNVPEWTWSAAVDYRRPVSDRTTLFASADLGNSSGYFSTLRLFATLPLVQRDGRPFPLQVRALPRTVVNARFGADFGAISAYVFAQNLTNDTSATYAGGVIQANQGARPRPRTIGAGVSLGF